MIPLTALILTKDEEANIGRTLSAIEWIDKVLIVDSFSLDRTLEIGRKAHPNVVVLQREFDSFAGQCNFGLSQVTTEWVLSMDADYVLSPEISEEIQALSPCSDTAGYSALFRYCIFGRPLRGTIYPRRTVLYRRSCAKYRDEGHGHRVVINGRVANLSGRIDHDDRKPFNRWLEAQKRYAKLEATHLHSRSWSELSWPDRLRRAIFPATPAMFVYTLLGRGLILDGWPGWLYVCQRTIAELMLSKELLKRCVRDGG